MKLSGKAAKRIAELYNGIFVAEMMVRDELAKAKAAPNNVPFDWSVHELFGAKAIREANDLFAEFGIVVIGYEDYLKEAA